MKTITNYYPENNLFSENTKICVWNLTSPRSGNPVENQFCIRVGASSVVKFQSYNTTCMAYADGILTVYPEAFGYSVTTSKYSKQFLIEELAFSVEMAEEVKKLAKANASEISRDCPLYIDVFDKWTI